MSVHQLTKLNTMVEKLLETATLDSNSLNLDKEHVNIIDILYTIIERPETIKNKTLSLKTNLKHIPANIDVFHFEKCFKQYY